MNARGARFYYRVKRVIPAVLHNHDASQLQSRDFHEKKVANRKKKVQSSSGVKRVISSDAKLNLRNPSPIPSNFLAAKLIDDKPRDRVPSRRTFKFARIARTDGDNGTPVLDVAASEAFRLARIFIEFVKVHAKWVDRTRVAYMCGAWLQRATRGR